MTVKELEEIRKSSKIIKITYRSNNSSGVMFIKESMLVKQFKKFNKAFKDCIYSMDVATNEEMEEQQSKIRNCLRRL